VVVSFLNQHGLNLAAEDAVFRQDLLKSDILLRDGVGMEICLKLLGRAAGMNTNGTDFIPSLLAKLGGRRVAVFGTQDPWLSKAASRISELGVEIVAQSDGFNTDQHYVDLVAAARPHVVLLAMGMPRQERLATLLTTQADWPMLILNGGAILDFYAERFARAPRLVQALRLEWLFRLAQEPKRLANRYIVGGGTFVWRVAQLRASNNAGQRS